MQQDLSALNRQAIGAAKAHMGGLAWPTVVLTVLVLTGFVANLYLFATGVTPWIVAVFLYGALTYMSYTPLHEAVHGNIHGRFEHWEALNTLCGYLMAPLIMVPFASHKVEHFTHHRYTNQADKDPDFVVKEMGDGPLALVVTGCRFLWVQNSFLVRECWASATLRERLTYVAEMVLSLGWRLAFALLVAREGTVLLLVSGYLLGGFFTAYWFAYRPHRPYSDSARYRNTNSLIMPAWMKPLEWFWLGQNLHSIHHLFPRVPFFRYHALHAEIEPIMRAHGTPMIGIFDQRPVAPSPA